MPAHPGSQHFKAHQRATTSIEYALIAALMAIAIVSALRLVGETLTTPFNDAAAGLEP